VTETSRDTRRRRVVGSVTSSVPNGVRYSARVSPTDVADFCILFSPFFLADSVDAAPLRLRSSPSSAPMAAEMSLPRARSSGIEAALRRTESQSNQPRRIVSAGNERSRVTPTERSVISPGEAGGTSRARARRGARVSK